VGKAAAVGLDLSMPLFAPGCFARLASAPCGEEEPVYPGTCRPKTGFPFKAMDGEGEEVRRHRPPLQDLHPRGPTGGFVCRTGRKIAFTDGFFGSQQFQAGRDFGDFVVWRRDDVPSYQLAVVVDDAAMRTTEVVRGADFAALHRAATAPLSRPGVDAPGFLSLPAGHRCVRPCAWPNAMTH